MFKKLFWTVAGFVCASWIAFVLAPQSGSSGLMFIIAGLVLLGGIAKSAK
jgi:hypothetical protein